MKKRILSALLALCLIVVWLPGAALAATTNNGLTYQIENGEATLTAVPTSLQGTLEIPATLGDCPVTKLGSHVFDSCAGLTGVTLPETVREIGDYAFRACAALEYVYLPAALEKIGEGAFAGCSSALIIYGELDSYAEQIAKDNNFVFLASEMPFTDVGSNDWFYWNVYSVYTTRLMYGTSNTTFSPNAKMTRAMLAAVLYRLAGSPDASGLSCPFNDVPSDYYTDAVKWCASKGIVYGTSDTTFSPNSDVTREQTVAMFSRYCKNLYNCNVSSVYPMNVFTDTGSISSYAVEPFCWAVENGIISGMGTTPPTLAPKGSTTRAELATMMVKVVQYLNDEGFIID